MPVRPPTARHQNEGFWQSSCWLHAGAQKPKSPAPLPEGEYTHRPFITPPQLGVLLGFIGSPPSTQGCEQALSPPVKFTQMPAHCGVIAIGSHLAPAARPVLGESTHTA